MLTGITCLDWSCDVRWDHVLSFFISPFVDGIVRAKASVCSHIFYVIIIREVVKEDVFEFIGRRHTKKWMGLCDSHQDWF